MAVSYLTTRRPTAMSYTTSADATQVGRCRTARVHTGHSGSVSRIRGARRGEAGRSRGGGGRCPPTAHHLAIMDGPSAYTASDRTGETSMSPRLCEPGSDPPVQQRVQPASDPRQPETGISENTWWAILGSNQWPLRCELPAVRSRWPCCAGQARGVAPSGGAVSRVGCCTLLLYGRHSDLRDSIVS